MDPNNPLDIVRYYAAAIQNGRQLGDALRHAGNEMVELSDEIDLHNAGLSPGPDGIVGEAIDVIACMLDIIFVHAPQTTDEQINTTLLLKCQKWERRYSNSIDGDRSID